MQDVYNVLLDSDWLVLYQHAPREAGGLGQNRDRKRLAELLGAAVESVLTFWCEEIAADVAFFAVRGKLAPEKSS